VFGVLASIIIPMLVMIVLVVGRQEFGIVGTVEGVAIFSFYFLAMVRGSLDFLVSGDQFLRCQHLTPERDVFTPIATRDR
jgi:TRAP-type mannitol/chloroaromatic compound transport system permease large subunit